MPDLHEIGVSLFIFFSVLSLVLVISKPVAKEFETTASTWIRAFKHIQEEWRTLTIKPTSEPPPPVSQTGSKHELGSGSRL
jgi:hypothetical protein